MVYLSYAADRHATLGEAWRAAVGCHGDRESGATPWRADVGALLGWIDVDTRGSPMLAGAVDGAILLDGPTTTVAEIVWRHSCTQDAAFVYVDLVDLCRALECAQRMSAHRVADAVAVAILCLLMTLITATAALTYAAATGPRS